MNFSRIEPKLVLFALVSLILFVMVFFRPGATIVKKDDCDAKCFEAKLVAAARDKGIGYSLEMLLRLEETESVVKENCHYIVHSIGWEAYEQQKTIPAALDMGKLFLTFCEAGFTHGVLEHALLDTEGSPLSLADVCDRFPSAEDKFLRRHCFHAIGHALLAQNYELLSALEECDKTRNYFDAELCHEGVFHELIIPAHLPKGKQRDAYSHPDDNLWPCAGLPARYSGTCFHWTAATKLYISAKGDASQALALCQSSGRELKNCSSGVGRINRSLRDTDDPSVYVNRCLGGPVETSAYCIEGIVMTFIGMDVLEGRAEILKEKTAYCQASPQSLQSVCFRALGMLLPYLYTNRQDQWPVYCRELAGSFASDCSNGAEERYLRNRAYEIVN